MIFKLLKITARFSRVFARLAIWVSSYLNLDLRFILCFLLIFICFFM